MTLKSHRNGDCDMKKFLILGITISFFLSGCLASKAYLKDPGLQAASLKLAKDYWDGQKIEESEAEADRKYGAGCEEVPGVVDYICDACGTWFGKPAVGCQVKHETKTTDPIWGTNVQWEDYVITFGYSKKLRERGDPYSGLRIKSVSLGKMEG